VSPQHPNSQNGATAHNPTAREAKPLGQLHVEPGRGALRSNTGMVVSVNAEATRVGIGILEAGGNAIDAAVAVSFALAVTHPSAGNLGGGGFWLIHKQQPPAETLALDFRETAPRAFDERRFEHMVRSGGMGPDSVAIPGTVAGLFEAHRRFGFLPWARLLTEAIQLASSGYTVSRGESSTMHKLWHLISRDSKLREQLSTVTRKAPHSGERLTRAALARTLEAIRDSGRDGFYRGIVAQSIIEALGPNASVTLQDLAEYTARWRTPREFRYRDYLIRTMPLPSAGGIALTEELTFLDHRSLKGTDWESVPHLHLLLETLRRADRERLLYATDPDRLSRSELLALESRCMDPNAWATYPVRPDRAGADFDSDTMAGIAESVDTTHFSIVDSQRNIVSATTTLSSAFGAKVATNTGVILNNSLASFALSGRNSGHPGQRTTSSMCPTLVFDSSGPVLVLGTPGGDTIPSTLTQIVSNMIDFGLPLTDSVDAPRVHQSFKSGCASYEANRAINKRVRKRLEAMGHVFEPRGPKQGDANCILLTQDYVWGYADPREGGLALAQGRPAENPPY
jgi:gamma-glutamyltranspeptidase/glutathione hydrolase